MQDMERISSFIKSFIMDDADKELSSIYNDAIKRGVPVIRPETRELLKTQILLKKPAKILEIGTAVGYSSLLMSQYIDFAATITTIELDEARADEACANIKKLGKDKVINVLRGDAAEVLKTLNDDTYDLIFVDAAKGQYINYYEDVLRVSKCEALIISDNVLQDGDVLESHFTVEKRNRTIHGRMREYLYTLTHDERVTTAILSSGDGVALSIRK